MEGEISEFELVTDRAEFWVGLAAEIGQGSQEDAATTISRAKALAFQTGAWVEQVMRERRERDMEAMRSVARDLAKG